MQDVSVQIDIEDSRWEQAISNIYDVVDVVKSAVFSYVYEHENLGIFNCKKSLVVNLCLSNDSHVQQLNRDFRHMDKPTNVLSFENAEKPPKGQPWMAGDIIIAYQTVRKEAKAQQKPFLTHLAHLLVHGTLHLQGYDHLTAKQAKPMESLEIKIMKKMGYPNPYQNVE
jgi:probable rRNA maturation factor